MAEGDYEIRTFGDNGNGGVLVPRVELTGKSWADELPFARLPLSRLLRTFSAPAVAA